MMLLATSAALAVQPPPAMPPAVVSPPSRPPGEVALVEFASLGASGCSEVVKFVMNPDGAGGEQEDPDA